MTTGEFVSYPLNKLYPNKSLPASIFLYVGGRFIKYIGQDDFIPCEKFEYLIKRRFEFLFIKYHDLPKFDDWSDKIMGITRAHIISEVGSNNSKAVDAHLKLENEIINFVTREITSKSVQDLLDKTKDYITEIRNKKKADQFLAQMMTFSKRTASHCMNVANLSTFLALNLGHISYQEIEDI